MKKFTLLFTVLLFMLPQLSGCGKPREAIAPSGRKIRIGVLGPLSGGLAIQGRSGLEGIKAARKLLPMLNNGDALELIPVDDGDQPDRAVAALRELVEEKKVAVVVDFSNSASVMAMEPWADRLKVPLIAVQATHPEIARHNKFVIQLCFDDIFQGTVAALFVRDELLIERVAVVDNPENPYSVNLARQFRQKFEETGGQVIEIFSYNDQDDDLSALVESLRAKRIQLLYMPIQAKCFINFIEAARKIGWHPKMMGADGLLPTILDKYRHNLKHLEGLIATDFYSDRINRTEREKRWRSVYTALFHHQPTSFAALGAEAYAVLCNAMNRCMKPDNSIELNAMLRQTTNFPGLAGKLTITPDGKTQRPLIVNTIEDGRLKFVVKVF